MDFYVLIIKKVIELKRFTFVIILSALVLSLTACGAKQEPAAAGSTSASVTTAQPAESETSVSASAETAEAVTAAAETSRMSAQTTAVTASVPEKPLRDSGLINKMTDFERAYVTKRSFSLLDEGKPPVNVVTGNVNVSIEAITELYNSMAQMGGMTQEEADEIIAESESYSYNAAMINGAEYSFYIPPEGYDGGKIEFGELSFETQDEYFDWVKETFCKEQGMDYTSTKDFVEQTKQVFKAVMDGICKIMPDRNKSFTTTYNAKAPFEDYRFLWEYDPEKLAAIKDRIEEYVMYDENLGIEFLVHVTLPPDYDESKTYPVFLLTDGVWRLNDHAALYEAMENGEAAPVILVSLAYNYCIKGTDNQFRDSIFIKDRNKLLDFITDDLMPCLGERYYIDYASSALFGHSMGGVFSHYALFNSDRYENQPFGKYIIGSPALFNLYGDNTDFDAEGAMTEYGYFDRHDVLDKKVFLCGGTLEDPDYQDAYYGHDSTLTGLAKMNDRISSHTADVTYKLYESHHYQYVPGMLEEYLKTEYPVN